MEYLEDDGKLTFRKTEESVLDADTEPNPTGSILYHSEGSRANNSAESNVFLVGFDKSDDIDPRKWSKWYLHYVTCVAVTLTSYAMISSTIPTAFAQEMATELKLNSWSVDLAISHYEICFCVGPLMWGPLSDKFGRRRVLLLCVNGLALLHMGCALSQNAAVATFVRILAGLFASGLLPVSGAIVADIWDLQAEEQRLAAFVFPFATPQGGPSLGALMAMSGIGWRGIFWVSAIFGGVFAALIAATLPETHRPTILVRHASMLRLDTRDDRYRAPLELAPESRVRILAMLNHEPVLILLSLYFASVVACLNIFFEALVIATATFTPITARALTSPTVLMGALIGTILYELVLRPRFYLRRIRRYSRERVPPEQRLAMAIGATPFVAMGVFWFGWTLFPGISIGAPLFAVLFVGISSYWLVFVIFAYTIDVYANITATALGFCIAAGSVFPAVLPVISSHIFRVLGLHWASTLSGCLMIATIPFPLVLMRYGSTLRAKSRYARQ
ncbi:MFS general substrate transporter [Dichomitus squalens]|uniref:MFS general substrate transporter n=1 Tax=Dichomitus squalens TaxID=114155 RepID=A0A4Q9M981_9APHY|nr:MFS general substrate transporter [Dichomitus squalens]